MSVIEGAPTLAEQATGWLNDLESAVAHKDSSLLRALFLGDSYWSDKVAFTWDLRQTYGVDAIEELLFARVDDVRPKDFSLDPDRPEPFSWDEGSGDVIDTFFLFRTSVGHARGLVRLRPQNDTRWGMQAFMLGTSLDDLDIAPERVMETEHPGHGWEKEFPGQTWTQYRASQAAYADRDPQVLVVGGNQSGVSTAAQLKHIGIDALVVDKLDRPGDSWRTRYESLALHNLSNQLDLPFLPLPSNVPAYMSRDVWADYLESYVRLMDLNYWSSTEMLNATFDESSKKWEVALKTADGSERILHPDHVIMATGSSGSRPAFPDLPGLDEFTGEKVHSSQFRTGRDFAGKRAMVVGVGTSAHDIALDLYHNDAQTCMLQRSTTSVVSIDSANLAYSYWNMDMPQPEADQRFTAGLIHPLLLEGSKSYTLLTNELDAELHRGLEKAGLRLDTGDDGTGWLMKFFRYGGGYYLDVGCSSVIIEGGIEIVQTTDIDRFVPEGVRLKDGTVRELDVVVMATGFQNLQADVARMMGEEVAHKVGEIAGFAADGEIANLCRPTGQPHLWFIFGGIAIARITTSWLALQIKAQLEGIVPTFVRRPDMSLGTLD